LLFYLYAKKEKVMAQTQGSSNRGFAAMDEDKQREIASKGGRAAHEKGTAHEFTSQQAAIAGSKGGKVAHARGTAHEFTSREAAEAGRKGGMNSHSGRS
jgi:general stress protein YciG